MATTVSTYQEPKSRRTVGWTPAKIKQAETQADAGKLAMAADLCEAMFGDDRYSGVMQTLANVVSLPIRFEPGVDGADPDTDPQCIALGGARGDFWRMLPESTQAEIIRWTSTLGVALVHIREWAEDEATGRIVADCDVWSARWLSTDDNGNWVIETASGKVTPELGAGEWMIWTAYRKRKPWAIAPWRGLARWWLAKAFAILDELDISDKQGEALKVAEDLNVESQVDDDQRAQMVADMRSLGRRGVYAPPPGVSLKLLESSGKGAEICAKIIEQANAAFAVNQLGGNLSAEVTGGSFAAASVHSQITHDRIRSIAAMISTESHFQLLKPWAEFNFGTSSAPWAEYDVTPPEDKSAKATQLASVSQSVGSLMNAGLPIDASELREKFGVPIDVDRLEEVRQGQVFQYHLTFGVLTTNEIRERLGLPPISGGDKPPMPVAEPSAEAPVSAHAHHHITAGARSHMESRAIVDLVAARAADDALESGDEYADRLEVEAKAASVKALRPHVDELKRLVLASGVTEAATEEERVDSLRKLRQGVIDIYAGQDPALFSETVERAEILAAMAGCLSATDEV